MSSNLAYSPAFRLLIDNGFAQVWLNETTGEKALICTADFMPGETICSFYAGETLDHATYLTIQLDAGRHITLQPAFLQYVNHSCSPNAFFDTTHFVLVCVKEIKAGDEVSFFYPSAEWQMDQPFACNCQSYNCHKYIRGAAFLSKEILKHYQLTAFISQQLNNHQQ
ncbi:MAG: SET domain-containing protein-lysine N-methyltransferase [Bacteroidota bacterium]